MSYQDFLRSRPLTYPFSDVTKEIVLQNFRKFGGVIFSSAIGVEVVDRAHAELRELFSTPESLASMPYDDRLRLGYTPPGREGFQSSPNEKNFSRDSLDLNPAYQALPQAVSTLFRQAENVAHQVIEVLEKGTELKASDVPPGTHILRAARYLASGTTRNDVLFGEHLDFGLMTVFIGTDQTGLEAKINGKFEQIILSPGEVLVGVGTPLVQYLGQYGVSALRHRVVGGEEDRLSTFFFYELDPDTILPKTGERYGDFVDRIMQSVRAPD